MSTIPDSPVAAWPFRLAEETSAEYRARTTQTSETSKTKKKTKTVIPKVKSLPKRFKDVEEIQPPPTVGSSFQLTVSLPWDNYVNDPDFDLKTMHMSIDIEYDQPRLVIWESLPVFTKASDRYPRGCWVNGDSNSECDGFIDQYTLDVNLSPAEIDMFIPRVFTAPPDLEERLAEAAVREAECRLERARQTAEAKRLASIKALEDKHARELAAVEQEVSEARKKLVALAPHKG